MASAGSAACHATAAPVVSAGRDSPRPAPWHKVLPAGRRRRTMPVDESRARAARASNREGAGRSGRGQQATMKLLAV